MSNYLNYKCPQCGGADDISLAVIVSAKLLPSGHKIDCPESLKIWERSAAACGACGYGGRAKEFAPPVVEKPTTTLPKLRSDIDFTGEFAKWLTMTKF